MHFEKKGKAQVAIEFLVLITIAFVIFVIYMAVAGSNALKLIQEEEYVALYDLSETTRNELIMASQVYDGYHREFILPGMLLNRYNYSVTNNPGQIIFSSENGFETVILVPYFNGTVAKGANSINKTGGIIYIN